MVTWPASPVYIHGLGLKAGIYTDAGMDGCSMYPDSGPKYMHTGSEGHYEQDFLQFSKWGFDYVKVDWVRGREGKALRRHPVMRRLLAQYSAPRK